MRTPGRDIIKDVMKCAGIGPKDFFGRTRLAHVVAARCLAIARMRAIGMGVAATARAMRRNNSTISYWTTPGVREWKKAYYKQYWLTHPRQRKQARAA